VLDLDVHLNSEKHVLVEMQVRKFDHWTNRTLIYACREIDDQARGDYFDYGKLQAVIQIAIMDYTLFPGNRKFYARYKLLDEESGYPFTDKLQFYVMDLTAIEMAKDEDKEHGLVDWANAFSAKDWEQLRKIDNAGVREAVKQMQTVMSTPEQRQMIWSRRLAQLDRDSQLTSARAEGRAEDRAEGRAEGKTEGRAEGEKNLGQLVSKLILAGRIQDAAKVAVDVGYREKLYAEFGLNTPEKTDES
jgi:predicted transposase/invertase (TIGR01784 family)